MPVAFRAVHWHPVRRTKQIASIARRFGTPGRWQPSGWEGGGRSGSSFAHSTSEIRHRSADLLIAAALLWFVCH